jgi:hypothetical protein
MTREAFIRDIWQADRLLAPPRVETDSPYLDTKVLAQALQNADLWLTVKAVEAFDPADFADVAKAQQEALRRAVARFRAVAAEVPAKEPAAPKQAERGREALQHVIAALRAIVLPEWSNALDDLIGNTENWAHHQEWAVKRDSKRLREPLLGTYEAPRLLIHTLDGRFLLDPITRFAAAAEGLVELCLMPSYDSAAVFRVAGQWYLRPFRAGGKQQRWSEETLRKAVHQLLQSA